MAAPRIVLTPELHVQIVASIRAGGFGHVAAQAWGVPKPVYESWLARGQGRRPREPYRAFAREVAAAQAQARLRAETRTFEEDSKFWLEHGPGRALRGEPGWGSPSRPPEDTRDHTESPLASPEFRAFGRSLSTICPERRLEVLQFLDEVHGRPKGKNGEARSAAPKKPEVPAGESPLSAPSAAPPPSAPAPSVAPAANPIHPLANGTPPPRAA